MQTHGSSTVQTPARRKKPAAPRRQSVTSLTRGHLCRAIVSLPDCLCEHDRPIQDRIVFFERPNFTMEGARAHLASLLKAAWGVDTSGWGMSDSHIYNINSLGELLEFSYASEGMDPELRMFETGCGGGLSFSVGPDRVHYARPKDVDLFVTPKAAARLQEHLSTIEAMYLAEPARLRKAQAKAVAA